MAKGVMANQGQAGPIRLARRTADRVLVTLFGPRWLQFRARRVWDRHARTRSLEATSSHDASDADTYWRSGQRDWGLVLAVANKAGLQARGSVIEIGCGLGRLTKLAAADFSRVIGVDVSGGCLAFEALIRDTGARADPSTSDPDTEREYASGELEDYAHRHGYEWAADQVIPSLTAGTHNLVIAWRKR